jgi:transmembrane 9 superfamily protein 2/4
MEDSAEEALEESGWKLVHGDVFRPPRYPRLFASLIGNGIQILGMAVVTICKNYCTNSFIPVL